MNYDPRRSFDIDTNGLGIESGSTILSGSNIPDAIVVSVPCYYFRTNGEIWYNVGSGPWVLLISAGGMAPNNIPEFDLDPVNPIAGITWVLHDGRIGSPIGMLLTLTNNVNSYKLSYKTLEGSVIRVSMI
jgi:hypothetical protein